MVQELTTLPSASARFGQGLSEGLSQQLPKEMEHYRKVQGLKELTKEYPNLAPFAKAASIYGTTPEEQRQFGQLSQQHNRAQALIQQGNKTNQKTQPFPQINPQKSGQEGPSKVPSLTKEDVFQKVQEGYIPPTIEDKAAVAGQAFDSNPAFFNNDPQKAIEWADQKFAQEEKIAEAYQAKHANLDKIQTNVVDRLEKQSNKLNTKVPADLYSKIEDEAIQATKPIKEGGRGLTEQQAMKEYGDKLNDASRDFAKIDENTSWGITQKPASDTLRSFKKIQQSMEKLDQTDNYAKQLMGKGISPKLSYSIAEPVSRVPELNSYLKNLPQGNSTETLFQTVPDTQGTLKIIPQLAQFVKNNEKASPLAIAHELEKKGYDPKAWLQYVTDHSNELNLRQKQSEQAATPLNLIDPWNDWWLSSFSGIE